MEGSLGTVWIILGSFLVAQTFCNDTSSNIYQDNSSSSDYSDGIICKLSAIKRILREMGITSTKRCLLQNKRDIAKLVSSYLNGDSSDSSIRKESYHNNILQNNNRNENDEHSSSRNGNNDYNLDRKTDDFVDRFLNKGVQMKSKRAGSGSYCCSPDCDVFMKTLSWPNPNIITCEA